MQVMLQRVLCFITQGRNDFYPVCTISLPKKVRRPSLVKRCYVSLGHMDKNGVIRQCDVSIQRGHVLFTWNRYWGLYDLFQMQVKPQRVLRFIEHVGNSSEVLRFITKSRNDFYLVCVSLHTVQWLLCRPCPKAYFTKNAASRCRVNSEYSVRKLFSSFVLWSSNLYSTATQ